MIDWIKAELLADGMISEDDLALLHVTTTRPTQSRSCSLAS